MNVANTSGNIFYYPIFNGTRLYEIIDELNETFSLGLVRELLIDTVVGTGLDGHPTLVILDKQNVPVCQFVNKDIMEQVNEAGELIVKSTLVGRDSTRINFKDELELFSGITLDEPISYSYATATFLRDVKYLLSVYGYGVYPVIDSKGTELNGMKVMYYGPGSGFDAPSEVFRVSPLVVHLKIPDQGAWKDIYLKTG